MGTLRQAPLHKEEQFYAVDDFKLRMTLAAIADRFSSDIQNLIYRTYQDDELHAIYRRIRASGIYQHGGKSKTHRKLLEFPNVYIRDFVDTVMTELHGPEWLQDRRNLRHELVAPWLVIELKYEDRAHA